MEKSEPVYVILEDYPGEPSAVVRVTRIGPGTDSLKIVASGSRPFCLAAKRLLEMK